MTKPVLKVWGYTSLFSPLFSQWEITFVTSGLLSSTMKGILVKERTEKGATMKLTELLPLKVYPFIFNVNRN